MPNTSLPEAAPTTYLGYFDYAQLLERLRLKRSYAAGFMATKRTGSVQVAVRLRSP
ncbi:MAG: hypothetical protein V7L20_02435 [Nostoc sp.]|uniref:hypothetical protein n=1 Tax=Nostoc sp. TaxID=1180 RepID=UPI002FF8FB88